MPYTYSLAQQILRIMQSIVGSIAPALVGVFGVWIGLRGRQGAEDRQWQRQQRVDAYVEFLAACDATYKAALDIYMTKGKHGGCRLSDDVQALNRMSSRVSLLGSSRLCAQVAELEQCALDIVQGALPPSNWADLDWKVGHGQYEILYGAAVQAARGVRHQRRWEAGRS